MNSRECANVTAFAGLATAACNLQQTFGIFGGGNNNNGRLANSVFGYGFNGTQYTTGNCFGTGYDTMTQLQNPLQQTTSGGRQNRGFFGSIKDTTAFSLIGGFAAIRGGDRTDWTKSLLGGTVGLAVFGNLFRPNN